MMNVIVLSAPVQCTCLQVWYQQPRWGHVYKTTAAQVTGLLRPLLRRCSADLSLVSIVAACLFFFTESAEKYDRGFLKPLLL